MVVTPSSFNRREFLKASTALAVGATSIGSAATLLAKQQATKDVSKSPLEYLGKGRIYKTVKWGMIGTTGSILEKFQLMKELGYDGMELVSPWKRDITEVHKASEETGMPVHALVDMKHWQIRLSSPDPKVREQGVEFLKESIKNARAF